MESNAFIYKLAIIFIPGILGRFLLDRLLFIQNKDKFYFVLAAFLIGVFSYLILDLFGILLDLFFSCATCGIKGDDWTFSSLFSASASILDPEEGVDFRAVFGAIPCSFFLSVLWAISEKNAYLTGVCHKLGLTHRTPEPDIWNHLFSSLAFKAYPHIVVYDRKNNLSYEGDLERASDTSATPELFLKNVTIYDSSPGEKPTVDKLEALYLSIEPERIEIEWVLPEPNGEKTE